MTQVDLSRRAGVSLRALRDIERNRSSPRLATLRRLAEALNVSAADRERLLSPASTPATAAGSLWIGVLGPLLVRHGMTVIDVGPSKQRLLLALLAVQPGQVVRVDEIVDILWQGNPPRTYQGLIHTYVTRLRDRLEPAARSQVRTITPAQGGYRLELARDQLDLARFDDLAALAWRAQFDGRLEQAMELFSAALDCWRGHVLSDAGHRLSHHPAAVAVSRRRLGSVLAYADIAINCGRYEQAMTPLSDAAVTESLHEGLHARLMLALAGTGQQAAALRLYAGIQSRLAEDLGIGPGPELRTAHLRVLRQDLPAAQGAYGLRGALLRLDHKLGRALD